ncbi:MAG: ribonuclease [Lysobacteraceae bacterium]|nr:MAG: ribonuclease [Xanthomonadaceae bacterium]
MMWPRQQPLPAPVGGGVVQSLPAGEAKGPLPPVDAPASSPTGSAAMPRLPDFLPPEARDTIAMVLRGGPFPHRQDGSVFGNREGHLPRKPRGWYREYTVDTPGLDHRGARRIVTGGDPPSEWYYSDDHYDSFRAFDPGARSGAPR